MPSSGVRSGITIAFQDEDIVDVGSVALDEITSDSATTVKVTLGDDAGDDFKVDNTSLVVEGDTGKVGVGTATPAKNLHVYGASGEVELRIQSDLSYSSIVHKDSGNELIIQNAATDGVTIFHDDTTERMRIDKDGNVGIGTNAPADKLHVVGDAALVGDVGVGIANPAKNLHVYGASGEVELRIQSDTSFCSIVQKDNNEMIIQNAASGGVMIFHDDSAERMRIDSDGKVGIGDNAPGTQLQMKGTAPYVTLKNSTAENSEGGCESKIIFEDHADAALVQIEGSHSGSSDDTKGKLILSTHTGSALTTALTINETQQVIIPDGKLILGDTAVSATASELNILDDVTATTAELNYSDTGAAVGVVVASKVLTVDANKDLGASGALNNATVDGYVHFDSSPADAKCSGTTATFTAGEALSIGEACYLKSDGKMWKAVATAAATSRCVAMAAAGISADAPGLFLLRGFLQSTATFPSYTIGGALYTPEAEESSENVPEQTAPDTDGDFVQVIGYAVTADIIYFDPDSTVIEVA